MGMNFAAYEGESGIVIGRNGGIFNTIICLDSRNKVLKKIFVKSLVYGELTTGKCEC